MKTMRSYKPVLYNEDTRNPELDSLITRREAATRCHNRHRVTILGTKKEWNAYRISYDLKVMGDKIFWKSTPLNSCSYKNGRLFGDITNFWQEICTVYNLDWLYDELWLRAFILKNRKDLWVSILKGTITNPEALCKAYSKRYFKGAFSYRTLKLLQVGYPEVNIWDIYYYTTDPDFALRRLIDPISCGFAEDDYDVRALFRDTLHYCKLNNTKLNPRWSVRRLTEEHQKQILEDKCNEIESISDTDILLPFYNGGLSLITNARKCYTIGDYMSNCIYRCYWPKVQGLEYLLVEGFVNDEYINLGIRVYSTHLQLDQVHTKFNGNPSEYVRNYCYTWIDDNKEALLDRIRMAKNKVEYINWDDV